MGEILRQDRFKKIDDGHKRRLMFVATDPKSPHRAHEAVGRMGVVTNQNMWIVDLWVGIENATISSYSDGISLLVLGEAGGVVLCLTPHQQRGGDSVFLRQPDYLCTELPSRTEERHALIERSTAIFGDQQTYERFACSSRQLDCNIPCLKVIGEIGVQRLFLMAPQEFNGWVSLQVSE